MPDCRNDPRFAAQIAAGTGYVPHTMLVVPLKRGGEPIGVLSMLDRRDGGPYGPDDVSARRCSPSWRHRARRRARSLRRASAQRRAPILG